MKTKELRGEGHCGIEVSVNVLEQHFVSLEVKAYDKHQAQAQARNEWECKRWEIPADERKAWEEANPRPEIDRYDESAALKKVMVFLRKLVLTEGLTADIFDEHKVEE